MNSAPFARLAARSFGALMLKGSGGVLAFAMAAVMAQTLGPEEFGQFARLLSAGLVLAQVALMGQPKLLLRFLGDYRATGQSAPARGLITSSLSRVLGACALIAAAIAVLWAAGIGQWAPLILLVPALALAEYHAHLGRALGHLGWALMPMDVIWRSAIVLAGLGLGLIALQPSGATVAIGAAALLLALVGVQRRQLMRMATTVFGAGARAQEGPEWRRSAQAFWGLALLGLMPQLMVVILAALTDPATCGALFAALRLTGLMALPLFALNLGSAPDIAGAMAAGQRITVQRMLRQAMRFLAPGAVMAALLLGAAGPALMGLFGASAAPQILPVLLIGAVANALAGPVGITLQMSGQERAFLAISAIGAVIGLGLLFWAVPRFGLMGAACAITAMQLISNGGAVLWCRAKLGLDPSVLSLLPLGKESHARHPV